MNALLVFLRSRIAVLAAVCVFLVGLGIETAIHSSVVQAWNLRFLTHERIFEDTLFVTGSVESVNAGLDPYVDNRFDAWGRLYNYPPIWLALRHVGVTSKTTSLFAICLATLGIAAAVTALPSRGWLAGTVAFVSMLGWPFWWGVERGNIDLVVFAAIVFGFLGIRGKNQFAGRALLIVGLAVLKIYPAALALMFVNGRRGWLRALGVGAIATAAVIATCGRDLLLVLHNTPHQVWRSFGAYAFVRSLMDGPLPVSESHVRVLSSVAAIGLAVAVILFTQLGPERIKDQVERYLPRLDVRSGPGAMAIAGLVIYCFWFVVGSGYDYRLMFLLLPLGALVREISQSQSVRALPVAMLLMAYQLSLYKKVSEIPYLMDPVVFVVCCAWLGRCLLTTEASSMSEQRVAVAN